MRRERLNVCCEANIQLTCLRRYLRKGLMCDATGKLSEVSCYGIASVFTPAAWRGRGYAKHMMRLLHWVLGPSPPLPQFPREWGETPTHSGLAQFSALYSDIGEFYAHCGPSQEGAEGWLIKSAFSTAWMLDDLPLRPAEYSTRTNEWKWLDISGVEKIWNEDVQWMKHDIIQSVKSTGRTSFAFLPTDGVGTFQIHRSNFTAPNIPAINKWGIFLEDNLEDKARTFATWAVEWQTLPTTLIITRLRASTKRFPALMEYILDAAKEYGAQKVEVWNIPYDLENVAIGLGGRTSERKEHLPAFKWYGSDKNEEVEWLFNEK